MKKQRHILKNGICLHRACEHWISQQGFSKPVDAGLLISAYVSRSTREAFKSWLFEQGACLIQINGRQALEFFDEKDLLMFSLKWS